MISDMYEKGWKGWKGWTPVGGIRKIGVSAKRVSPGYIEKDQSRVSTLCPFFAERKGGRSTLSTLFQVGSGNRLTANQFKACHV